MSWWTACAQRTLTEQIPAPPADVRAFYLDLNNIALVHPLVTSVRPIARSADGNRRTYRVHDRIPLGPLTIRVSYLTTLHIRPSGEVLTEARQFPRVRLHGVVTFAPAGAGTRLTERIRIEAPRGLAALTTREAVKAHTAMLAGIRRHFS